MTQEKLEQRIAELYADWLGQPGSSSVAGDFAAFAVRAELQKAAEIVESKIQYDGCMCKPCRTARTTAADIRKLMD